MTGKNIAIITQPLPNVKGGNSLLEKFIRMLEPNTNQIFVLTSSYPQRREIHGKVKIINHSYRENSKFNFTNVIEFLVYQLKLSVSLLKNSPDYEVVFFHLGAMALILPLFTSKLLGKRVIIVMTGSPTESIKIIYRSKMGRIPFYCIYYLFDISAKINFRLANLLIVYTKSVITEWNLSRYSSKIQIADDHFIDFERFRVINEFKKREKFIGFVGRLSAEKGILNLIEAIPPILKQHNDWVFLIIGTGELENKIKEDIHNKGLNNNVKFIDWVSQEQIPGYYNQLRILVLPSYTEGLPNVIIEGMACGTMILANRVGSIPDIIADGETGFIMNDNSPETIVNAIDRVISFSDPERIVKNADKFVKNAFTFEEVVNNFEKILS